MGMGAGNFWAVTFCLKKESQDNLIPTELRSKEHIEGSIKRGYLRSNLKSN